MPQHQTNPPNRFLTEGFKERGKEVIAQRLFIEQNSIQNKWSEQRRIPEKDREIL